jgi:hypothetical protein
VHHWAGKKQLLLLFLDAGLLSYQLNPRSCILRVGSLEVEIACWREQTKDVLALVLWVFKEGDGGKVLEVDLVPQLGLLVVFVDRDGIATEDNENGLPCLGEC